MRLWRPMWPARGLDATAQATENGLAWERHLHAVVDCYEQVDRLAASRLTQPLIVPRLLSRDDVAVAEAYAHTIARAARRGAMAGCLAGGTTGVYLSIAFGGSTLVAALSLALAGLVLGYCGTSFVAWGVCYVHKRIFDKREERCINRLFHGLVGRNASQLRHALETWKVRYQDENGALSRGQRAVRAQAERQILQAAEGLERADAAERQRIKNTASRHAQHVADALRADAFSDAVAFDLTYARQRVRACSKRLPARCGVGESLQSFLDEVESADVAQQVVKRVRGYLTSQPELQILDVLSGLAHLCASHPLISTTSNGRRILQHESASLANHHQIPLAHDFRGEARHSEALLPVIST